MEPSSAQTESSTAPTPGVVSVRAVEKSDAGPLAVLMTELGYPTRPSEMQMRLDTILANSEYRTFVAVSAGEVCGMIGTCVLYTHEHNSPAGRIIALVVSEKMRGRGVGRALIRAAETDFAARNIKRIGLNTRFQREQAHLFYERLGYVKNGFRFVKELEKLAD